MNLSIKNHTCAIFLLFSFAMPTASKAEEPVGQQVVDDAQLIEKCLNRIDPAPSNPPTMSYGHCENLVENACYQAAEYKDDPTWRRCLVRETEAFHYIAARALEEAVQSTSNPDVGERLVRSQEIWEDFRDTHCRTLADRYASDSFFSSALAICELKMTSDRAVFLRGYSLDYYVERY